MSQLTALSENPFPLAIKVSSWSSRSLLTSEIGQNVLLHSILILKAPKCVQAKCYYLDPWLKIEIISKQAWNNGNRGQFFIVEIPKANSIFSVNIQNSWIQILGLSLLKSRYMWNILLNWLDSLNSLDFKRWSNVVSSSKMKAKWLSMTKLYQKTRLVWKFQSFWFWNLDVGQKYAFLPNIWTYQKFLLFLCLGNISILIEGTDLSSVK